MPSDKSELAQRLSLTRPEHTVRGFIFNSILALVSQRAGSEAVARLAESVKLKKPIDFFSYPAADFLRLLYATVDVLEPYYGSVDDTFRACGAATVSGFFESHVGNTLTRLVGRGDPKRAFSSTSTVYKTLVSYGSHDCEPMEGRKLRIVFRGDMQPMRFHEGSLRAALMAVGGGSQSLVQGTARSLDHSEFLMEW
ncbi:TIGR02265 family protein [Pyxidicoccus sp. 3LG]